MPQLPSAQLEEFDCLLQAAWTAVQRSSKAQAARRAAGGQQQHHQQVGREPVLGKRAHEQAAADQALLQQEAFPASPAGDMAAKGPGGQPQAAAAKYTLPPLLRSRRPSKGFVRGYTRGTHYNVSFPNQAQSQPDALSGPCLFSCVTVCLHSGALLQVQLRTQDAAPTRLHL